MVSKAEPALDEHEASLLLVASVDIKDALRAFLDEALPSLLLLLLLCCLPSFSLDMMYRICRAVVLAEEFFV